MFKRSERDMVMSPADRSGDQTYQRVRSDVEDNPLKEASGRMPLVSIIVPLKNEREDIEFCMKSLLSLDYQKCELLTVDTGSTDGTYQMVEEIARHNPQVHLLHVNGNAAIGRNLGLKVAKGEIVAFIDGDCTAPADWLGKLVYRLIEEPVTTVGVGGPNIPVTRRENVRSESINAILNTFLGSAGSVQVRVGNNDYVRSLSTANSAFRVEKLRTMGGFDPRLELCEDSDLCRRLTKTGSKLRFVRDATVYHHREYHSLRKFGQHMFRYGRGRAEAIIVKPRTNTSFTSLAVTFSLSILALLLALSVAGSKLAEWLLMASASIYLLTIVLYALALSKGRLRVLATAIPAFMVLHASYATGIATGMLSGIGRKLYGGQRS